MTEFINWLLSLEIEWSDIWSATSAIAALATFFIAWRALHSWKREVFGKRKIQVAAEVMSCAENLQSMIEWSHRTRQIKQSELDEIKNGLLERNVPVYDDRLKYLVPGHRVNNNWNLVEQLRKLRNEAQIYISPDIGWCLGKIDSLRDDFQYISDMSYADNEKDKELYKKRIKSKCYTYEDISDALEDVMDELRENLTPLYKPYQMHWKRSKEHDKIASLDEKLWPLTKKLGKDFIPQISEFTKYKDSKELSKNDKKVLVKLKKHLLKMQKAMLQK